MRCLIVLASVASLGALALCGCGSSKPAKDPAEVKTSDEPPPKWDTSSESADLASHPKFSGGKSSAPDTSNEPSAAPPAPRSPVQQERKDSEYDKEATEVVLKRAARQVKDNCGAAKDEDGKAPGPWGKTTVSINLGHGGRSKGATVPPPYDSKPAGRCILQAFSNLTYPPWRGADANVDWEVELVQPK
jgi:hypothetical protein